MSLSGSAIEQIMSKKKQETKRLSITQHQSTTNNIKWYGTAENMLVGMIYIREKYKNICIPLKKFFNASMSDLCIRYVCNIDSKKKKTAKKTDYKLYFPSLKENDTEGQDFKEELNNCFKNGNRFAMLPIFLYWYECDRSDAHFNFYIIDNKMKTIERFDPYGVMKWESYETYDWLDKSMKAYLKKNKMDYTYFSPEEYCPVVGLQHKEEGEREKGVTKHKDSDSDGYCGAWCLFYTEMRLKNPDLKKKELLSTITKQLKENPKSFKSFIKTYSTFVLKMKSEIKEKINQLCGGRKTQDNLNKCENVTMNKYIVNNLI